MPLSEQYKAEQRAMNRRASRVLFELSRQQVVFPKRRGVAGMLEKTILACRRTWRALQCLPPSQ